MKKRSNLIYFLITFLVFTSTNLYLSSLIPNKLANGWDFSNNLLKIVYVQNTGAAFSIMQNSINFLIFASIIAVLLITYYIFKNIEGLRKKELFFLSLLTSGILGNLYERIAFGYVRDFFELTFVNFPIFNISDIFINIGVFGIIVMIILTKKPIKLL